MTHLKSKYFPYFLIFLVGTTIYALYHINVRFLFHDKLRPDRLGFVRKKEHHANLIKNYQPFCGPYSLDLNDASYNYKNFEIPSGNNSACSLSGVSRSGCENIMGTYYQTSIAECGAESAEICRIEGSDGQRLSSLKCNFDRCHKIMRISVGIINTANGILSWHHYTYDSISEKNIIDFAMSTLANKNPFMFIECTRDMGTELITQLLVLPYHYTPPPPPAQRSHDMPPSHSVNINMILVDSISRQHFYRTLPDTVRYLQKLRYTEQLEVLDFELFHSIKGRTYENLQALFEGEIREVGEEFEGLSTPPKGVDFSALLSKFRRFGYTTLYQEDLCWEYDWGLIKDTGVYQLHLDKDVKFSSFVRAIANGGIDNLGLTHSICEMFRRFRIIDGFNYLGDLCFSGEYIHDYFLDYASQALNSHTDNPLFSFLLLNVGHEGTGRRIRTFDASLVKFLTSARQYKNTIHILFSDHGNSYGPFSRTLEGHLETFHPFMFMLIPQHVAALLGKRKLQTLKRNQKALVSILDLHFTLTELLSLFSGEQAKEYLPSNSGLFGPIGVRDCDDLQLHRGTLCFCDGWKSPLPTVSTHFLIAEFVLARVNGKIHKSQKKQKDSLHYCQHLSGITVSNVWQKIEKHKVLLGLDIKVQDDNTFNAIVSFTIDAPKSFEMKIDAIQRMSSFGIYRVCAHSNVPLEFCVCSRNHSVNSVLSEVHDYLNDSMFSVKTTPRKVHSNCLYILTRSYTVGAVFEASNICRNVSYSVKLRFTLDNMKLAANTYNKVVSPYSVAHLAVVIMDQPGIPWSYKYSSDISWKKVSKQ